MATQASAEIVVGDSYLPLFNDEHRGRFLLIESRRGCGKTRAILTHIVGRAMRYPKSRWFLARSTRTRLSETVLTTLEEQVFPLYGIKVPKGGRENRWDYKLPNGSVLIPVGLDDPSRSQSAEYSGGYMAEVTEPGVEQNDVLALAGAMRHQSPGVDYFQCIADGNPGPPNHWANMIAEPAGNDLRTFDDLAGYDRLLDFNAAQPMGNKWKRIITTAYDNPGYFNSMTWQWTKAGADYYEGLKHLVGHMRARWLHGLWVAAEGGVFPEFSEANEVAPFDTWRKENWPVYVFYDAGYDHFTAVIWVAVSPWGVQYIVAERKVNQQSIEQHAKAMLKVGEGMNIRRYDGDAQHVNNRTAQSPETIIHQFSKYGIKMYPWPRMSGQGAKEAAVSQVRELLVSQRLKVFTSCVETIGEFRSWRYKRNTKGEMLSGDDAFEDSNNDIMDCACAMAASKLKPSTASGRSAIMD